MAGAGDRAFRETCALFGVDLFYTEMISAKAVHFEDKKTASLAQMGQAARPCALQIFGSDAEIMAESAAKLEKEFQPEWIDLNFGCPVPKIVNNREGSFLMREPEKCFEIVSRVKEKIAVPLSVKIRAGWDESSLNAVSVARLCERAGADRIAVHGRCRADFYRDGTVKHEIIRHVKESVSIPVIGNGDVRDGESAREMLLATDCDALMIGRAAVGAPWVFQEIRDGLEGKAPVQIDKKEVIRHHLSLAFQYKPESAGREMRMHMAHYLKGFRGAAALREEASRLETEKEYLSLVARLPE